MRQAMYALFGVVLASGFFVGGYYWGTSEGQRAMNWRDQAELAIVQKVLALIQENKTQNAEELLKSREKILRSDR